MRLAVAVALLSLACRSLAVASPQVVPVTTCGQIVPRASIGSLAGNLDCTSTDVTAAVVLNRGARLDLNGFTISGGTFGVLCGDLLASGGELLGKCRVVGAGGTIASSEAHGIIARNVVATNLAIQSAGQMGIYTTAKATLYDVTITGSGSSGVRCDRGAKIVGSTITGNDEHGILSERRALLIDSTVTGNGVGQSCASMRCGDLYTARKPGLKNSTCEHSWRIPPVQSWGVCSLDN